MPRTSSLLAAKIYQANTASSQTSGDIVLVKLVPDNGETTLEGSEGDRGITVMADGRWCSRFSIVSLGVTLGYD
jgi:hypothetical protein